MAGESGKRAELAFGPGRGGCADSVYTLSPWDSLSQGPFTGVLLCAWRDTGGSKGLRSLSLEDT